MVHDDPNRTRAGPAGQSPTEFPLGDRPADPVPDEYRDRVGAHVDAGARPPAIVSISDVHGYLDAARSALATLADAPGYDPVVTADDAGRLHLSQQGSPRPSREVVQKSEISVITRDFVSRTTGVFRHLLSKPSAESLQIEDFHDVARSQDFWLPVRRSLAMTRIKDSRTTGRAVNRVRTRDYLTRHCPANSPTLQTDSANRGV